eukprot:TRINITY_DN12087_c0_g1_i2.p1 TRINITY_DN12087_c0_g1~~TRINITY_DN12087_c0_g1_i2.p1  ORF type:complete len:292 (+),score=64.83 TRINITY_DN12087_c0_g1_i2:57-932(+)
MAELLKEKHIAYVKSLDSARDTFEYVATEHLRMSGLYWGLSAMDLLEALPEMKVDEIREWVVTCQTTEGGFSGSPGHDTHLLYTLSAVQILLMIGGIERINKEAVIKYVAGLQQQDGSFVGDKWGEVDTRFSYCALSCLSLLGSLDAIDVTKATDFVASCKNFDGGFGCVPGAESHAGQIFCCVGALAIGNALHHVDADLLGWWLCERQTLENGGLNGRPEKKADVCYSWWVLSSLSILDRLGWIDKERLIQFILKCQVRVSPYLGFHHTAIIFFSCLSFLFHQNLWQRNR